MSPTPFMVRALPATRWVAFSLLLVFSFVVLGVSANYLGLFMKAQTPPQPRDGFSVAVPVLTIVSIAPMLFIDMFRRNAFTSMIVVELSVLGFFFPFWLAQAAWTTATFLSFQEFCTQKFNSSFDQSLVSNVCTDFQVSMAFGWLSWITLLAYFVMLLTISIIGAQKGASVWKSSVRDCSFGYDQWSAGDSQSQPANAQFVKFEGSQGFRGA